MPRRKPPGRARRLLLRVAGPLTPRPAPRNTLVPGRREAVGCGARQDWVSISAAPLPMSRSKSAGRRYSAKILTTPEAPERAVLEAIHAVLREAGARPGRSVDHHPRHDAGDQRDHRAQGRQDRAADDRGLSRHDRDPAREPVRAIRRQYRPAAAAGAAPAALSGARAHRRAAAGCWCRSTRRRWRRSPSASRPRASRASRSAFCTASPTRRTSAAPARSSPLQLPGVPITLSSEVSPEMREYERFSTACANAYVQPLIGRYLANLETLLRREGFACPLFLMLSGGGLTTVETAIRFPVRLVESGRRAARSSPPRSPGNAGSTRCCPTTWAARPPRSA